MLKYKDASFNCCFCGLQLGEAAHLYSYFEDYTPKLIGIKYSMPQDGFVNSLVFARSGRFIVAGLGQASVENCYFFFFILLVFVFSVDTL